MHQKSTVALAAAAVIFGGVTLMPTQASATCKWPNCTYYSYAWLPAYKPVRATVARPVLVKKPVTTYVYTWSTKPAQYTYYAPTYRRVVYKWRPGAPPIIARGR